MASRVHGACDLENDARGAIQKRVRWSARAGGALSGRAAACSHWRWPRSPEPRAREERSPLSLCALPHRRPCRRSRRQSSSP